MSQQLDTWSLDERKAIYSNPVMQTQRGSVGLCPKVQGLYSRMASCFNSYPNRPLASDLFYMTDDTYDEQRALVSLWQSFQGVHKEVNDMLVEKIGGTQYVMDLLPLVQARDVERKTGLSIKGDTVNFFRWTFDATAQDPKAKSAPGMITRAKTHSESRSLDYYGTSFVVPMTFVNDETQARVFKKYFEQMVSTIQETLSYHILQSLRHESLRSQARAMRARMPLREREFVQALMAQNAKSFALHKNSGVGWKGVADECYTQLRDLRMEPNTAILSAGSLRHVELVQPDSRVLSHVGDTTGHGVVVASKGEEGSHRLKGYGIRVYSSKRFRRPDGSRHDPTTGRMCVSQRFLMTPEHRRGTDDFRKYTTRQRSIRVRNGEDGTLEEITLQQAIDASGVFGDKGGLSALGQSVMRKIVGYKKDEYSCYDVYSKADILEEVVSIMQRLSKEEFDQLFTDSIDTLQQSKP